MTTTEKRPDAPFFMSGFFAPVSEETTDFDLAVHGHIPPDLQGRYLRNGPNPRKGNPGHWFLGDGMIHGVELRDGKATWYRSRWVRTPSFNGDSTILNDDLTFNRYAGGQSNTHVIAHGGKILSLIEYCLPTEVTPQLDTVGLHDFGGRLTTAMTAHPKKCPLTGELHLFSHSLIPPYVTYHRVDAAGNLVQTEAIDVPSPTLMHDFAITERYAIFLDLPLLFGFGDAKGSAARGLPVHWDESYGARIGVMPRGAPKTQPHWFDIEPCYVFHILNAFDDPEMNQITIDVARYPQLWRDDVNHFPDAHLHRWTVDLGSGKVLETPLDDEGTEFPRVDERRIGLAHRYGYSIQGVVGALSREYGVGTPEGFGSTALAKYDLTTGTVERNPFSQAQVPAEPVFVPSSEGSGEDEGWILSYVYDATRDASDLVILDARHFSGDPVATIALPRRVPMGFHGSWIPDVALSQ